MQDNDAVVLHRSHKLFCNAYCYACCLEPSARGKFQGGSDQGSVVVRVALSRMTVTSGSPPPLRRHRLEPGSGVSPDSAGVPPPGSPPQPTVASALPPPDSAAVPPPGSPPQPTIAAALPPPAGVPPPGSPPQPSATAALPPPDSAGVPPLGSPPQPTAATLPPPGSAGVPPPGSPPQIPSDSALPPPESAGVAGPGTPPAWRRRWTAPQPGHSGSTASAGVPLPPPPSPPPAPASPRRRTPASGSAAAESEQAAGPGDLWRANFAAADHVLLDRLGRLLVASLRHGRRLRPDQIDAAGWVHISLLQAAARSTGCNASHADIIEAARYSRRCEVDASGLYLRATYGHSVDLDEEAAQLQAIRPKVDNQQNVCNKPW